MRLLRQIAIRATTWLALIIIRFYQNWISPFKGYSCAYRVHAGGKSCSGYGYDVVKRFGAPIGIQLIQRRMAKCTDVFDRHYRDAKQLAPRANFQSGHCDASFDGCDPSIGDCDVSGVCDLGQDTLQALSSCPPDFSSGCGSSQQKSSKKLKYKPLPKSL